MRSWTQGHEFEQTLGESEGQRSLACCSPWGGKDLNMTQRLNNNIPSSRPMQPCPGRGGLNRRPRVNFCSLLKISEALHEQRTAWWWPCRYASLSRGRASWGDQPVVPRQAEEGKEGRSRCILPATWPRLWPPDPKINQEISTLSRRDQGFVTPNRITYGGSRALGRRYWELEMHAGVLRVYCLSAEYFVFTLELIQAHKTSAISTQQMH